jgi:hypothetical protein
MKSVMSSKFESGEEFPGLRDSLAQGWTKNFPKSLGLPEYVFPDGSLRTDPDTVGIPVHCPQRAELGAGKFTCAFAECGGTAAVKGTFVQLKTTSGKCDIDERLAMIPGAKSQKSITYAPENYELSPKKYDDYKLRSENLIVLENYSQSEPYPDKI